MEYMLEGYIYIYIWNFISPECAHRTEHAHISLNYTYLHLDESFDHVIRSTTAPPTRDIRLHILYTPHLLLPILLLPHSLHTGTAAGGARSGSMCPAYSVTNVSVIAVTCIYS